MQMQLQMEAMVAVTQMQMQLLMERGTDGGINATGATRSQDMTQLQNMDRNQLKNNIFLNIYVYK